LLLSPIDLDPLKRFEEAAKFGVLRGTEGKREEGDTLSVSKVERAKEGKREERKKEERRTRTSEESGLL